MRLLLAAALVAQGLSAQAVKPKPHVPLRGSESAATYARASAAYRAMDWDKAVEGFLAALKADPQFAGAALLAGDARYEQRKDAEAAALFAQAYRIDPAMEKAHEHRALALTRLGRLDEALDEAFAALDINPRYAHAWEDLDNLRKAKGLEPLDHLDLWDQAAPGTFQQDLAANERRVKQAGSSPALLRLQTLAQRGLLPEATFILAPGIRHWPAWEAWRTAHPGALRRFVEQQQLRPSEEALRR